MRLFVAIDLPEDVKAQLASLSFGVPGARWTDDEQLHLTLRFIGDADQFLYEEIRRSLAEIQFDIFDLALEGVGHFPAKGKPQVLWVGLEKNEPLLQLQKLVDRVVQQAGVAPDGYKFSAHITLARLKDTPMSRVTDYLIEHMNFKTEPFEITEFHLYSSVLTSKGSIYEVEETYELL